jgi:hypothetical protein
MAKQFDLRKQLNSTFAIFPGLCGLTETVQHELLETGGDFLNGLAKAGLRQKCLLPE